METSGSPSAGKMTSRCRVTLVLVALLTRLPSGAGEPFLNQLSPVLDTVANYGRSILGLDSTTTAAPVERGDYPLIGKHHGDVHVKDIGTLWDGVVHVPDFLSPMYDLYQNMGGFGEYGDYGVAHGLDQRYGFRIAVPYMGDFQYVRELGPGHYTKNLGPGKFGYASTGNREGASHSFVPPATASYGAPSTGYGVPATVYGVPATGYGAPAKDDSSINSVLLNKLKNYPWYSSSAREKPYV